MVTTKSEGKEPMRYVVIVPFDKDEFSKPYNAGRNNNERKRDNHGGKKGGFKNGGRGGRNGGSRGGFNRDKRNGQSGGYKKNFNRGGNRSGGSGNSNSGGTSLNKNNDFFGIFLGNSGNNGEE
jgi:hypothetical protein